MADKQVGESFELRAKIVDLASKRLEVIFSKSKEEKILKVLDKRRRKWRKRHGLHRNATCKPLDPSLREEKESLSDELIELRSVLLRTRNEGYTLARQLQEERDTLCANVIIEELMLPTVAHKFLSSRLESARARLSFSKTCSKERTLQLTADQQSPVATPQERIITDLQDTISRAKTLIEIKRMKFGMTPRVPPLHRRTLNNPLEQSLGLFDKDGELQASPVVAEVDDGSMEEVVGVGKSWASYEGLVTGSNSNGLSSLGHKADTHVENASLDRESFIPEPEPQDVLSCKHDSEETLTCELQVVHEEQVPAVAQSVEGTMEGMSYVTTLSHWHTPPPQDTSTEDGDASSSEEEEEVDTVQTSDDVDAYCKLEGVLRNLEQNAPQELRTKVAP